MKNLIDVFIKYRAKQSEEAQLLLNYKLALGLIVLVCLCVFLFELAVNDQKSPPRTFSKISTAKVETAKVETTYEGQAGEWLLKEDAELILKAHLLYKQGGNSLLDGIKKGCRVTKSRYKNYSTTTPKTTSIYKKLKPICEEYSIYL